MVNFAAYKSNLPSIQVPSLINPEAEQQEKMWGQVGNILDTVNKFALDEMRTNAKRQAEENAIKDVESGQDLTNLPQENTVYDEQYRASAMEAYTAQLNIDSTSKLAELQTQYQDNPTALKVAQDAYIKGTVKALPAAIRPQVNQSLSIKAIGDYSSVLNAYTSKQQKINSEIQQVSLNRQIEDIKKTPTPKTQEEEAAYAQRSSELMFGLENSLMNGNINAKEYEYHVNEIKNAKTDNYILESINSIKTSDPSQLPDFLDKVAAGNTGNPNLDKMPVTDRQDRLMTLLNKQSQIDAYGKKIEDDQVKASQKALDETFMQERTFFQENWDLMEPAQKREQINILRTIADTDKDLRIVDSLEKSYVTNIQTPFRIESEITQKFNNGELSKDDMNAYLKREIISVDDYNKYNKQIDNIPKSLINNEAFAAFKANLEKDYPSVNQSFADKMNLKLDENAKSNNDVKAFAKAMVIDDISNGTVTNKAQLVESINKAYNAIRTQKAPKEYIKQNGQPMNTKEITVIQSTEADPEINGAYSKIYEWKERSVKDGSFTNGALADIIKKNSPAEDNKKDLLIKKLRIEGILPNG